MGFRERNVTGFVVDADGSPVEGGTVSFELDKPLGYTDTHVVINRTFSAVTDAAGEFTISLWCDEDSLLALNYTVKFPISNSGPAQNTHSVTISLAYEDGSDKDIGTLIAESQPPPSSVPEATWQTLIDGRIAIASIDNLGDVQIDDVNIADGHHLVWDDAEAKWVNQPDQVEIGVAVSDETSDLTTGTAKVSFRMPYAMRLTAVRASANVAPVGADIIVDINEGDTPVSVLSTELQIDDGDKTSVGSGTPAVISDEDLADDALITIDIDQVGSGTPGKGLKVWLIGERA